MPKEVGMDDEFLLDERESNVLASSYNVLIFLITLYKGNFIPSASLVTICSYYGVTTKVNDTNITNVKQ